MTVASPPSAGIQTRSWPAPESKPLELSLRWRRGERSADQPLAVGRPDRVAVERRGPREPLGLALAVGGALPDVAPLGRPAHIGHRLAVGRPGGMKLERVACRELAGLSARQIHQIELQQC